MALWGLAGAVALLWPDRLAGFADGMPLDSRGECLLVGVLFPMLWWLAPRFLATRMARSCIVALLAWKILGAALLTQQGWCVRFEPSRPYVADQTGAPHAWDVRADWRADNPACSAVMTRAYHSLEEFPAWFFNLPPPDESWPAAMDRPPGATTQMSLRGYLNLAKPARLQFDTTADMAVRWSVDGGTKVSDASSLEPGVHLIALDATLTGERWRLIPLLDGREVSWPDTWMKKPSTLDRTIASFARWLPTGIVIVFIGVWLAWALRQLSDGVLILWAVGAASLLSALVYSDREPWARIGIAALGCAAALPLRPHSRNIRGAFVAIGVPWAAFVVACAVSAIGRFVLYEVGHDYWMYQRFAYRIVMQGRWLEGGTATFWFQPFYRWIAGGLHVLFGDSSVGEWFWDGACLLAIALSAFEITRRAHGFRWGLVAGVMPLSIFALGTPQYLIGRGLGEITSAGFLSAAALMAARSRHGEPSAALAAGTLATLAFFTRLNNLPMALGVSAFAFRRRALRPALIIMATVGAGTVLLALRTWYFTGSLDPLTGTQRNLLAVWQPGISFMSGIARTIDSVLMVLTVNDPPRFDPFAVPVVAGACVGFAAIVSSRIRSVAPLPAAVFFLTGIAGAFVARGSAYPGRFSMHILGVTCALSICAVAGVVDRIRTRGATP